MVRFTGMLTCLIVQPESEGATVDKGCIVDGPAGDIELLHCHATVYVVRRGRNLIP